MAQSVLSVIFKVLKQGKADRDVIQSVKGIKDAVGTATMVMGALAATAYTVNEALDATAGEFVRQADVVRNFSNATGMGAEEASRLIQVMDDLDIAQDKVATAMKAAVKAGIEPNIASLAALSDQYLALAPGVERGKFLLDKFGKSGLEMAEFMKLGSSRIREMSGAVDDSLIVTEKGIEEAKAYKLAVDDLNDSWMGFKMEIGKDILPVLTRINVGLKAQVEYNRDGKQAWQMLLPPLYAVMQANNFLSAAMGDQSEAVDGATQSWTANGDALERAKIKMIETEDEAEDFTAQMKELSETMSGDIGNAYDDYIDKQNELGSQAIELKEQIAQLSAQPWLSDEQRAELDELNGKLAENEAAVRKNANAYAERARQVAFNLLQERLAVDGLDEREFGVLLRVAENWDMVDKKTADVISAINENIDGLDISNVKAFQDTLDDIMDIPDSTTKKLKFVVEVKVTGDNLSQVNNLAGNGPTINSTIAAIPQAEGGDWWVTQPTLFLAGEAGPERATFTPAGQATPSDNSTNLTVYGGMTVVTPSADAQAISQTAARLANKGR